MSNNPTETFDWGSETTTETSGLLSTGIDILDRKIGGGIPPGKVIALSAVPASQSELFLYELAEVRDTVYLTTERREEDIESCLGAEHDECSIHRLPAENPFETGRTALKELSDQSTLIVDPVNLLEKEEPRAYQEFINDVKAYTVENQGIALLHCLDGQRVPEQRDRTRYLADIIFSLNTTLRGDSIENSLSIPKFRGGRALPEAIDLELTAEVTIDVSRKIA